MKSIKAFALLMMISTVTLMSCMKEYSVENGGSTGVATGTLKAGGSGECLPSSVHGIYIAGTTTTAANYIDVDVDITALGAYTLTTNVVNGYSFTATGFATALGVQTIRMNANGIPTASGANTFTVSFNTSQCNLVVDVFPAGTGNATFTVGGNPGDCTPATLAGTYTQGTVMTASNTVTIQLNVTVAGIYTVSTAAVNGVSFSGTGMLAVGTHSVALTASGTPTAAGLQTYTISGGGGCTFDVTYVAGTTPPTGTFVWSFKANGTLYSGTCDDAVIFTTPLNAVFVTGSTPGGDGDLSISITNAGGAITANSDYLTSAMTGRFAVFNFSNTTIDLMAAPTMGNMTIRLTGFSSATEVTGTFQGIAKADGGTGANVNITDGQFKANYP